MSEPASQYHAGRNADGLSEKRPDHNGQGIAGRMIELIKEKYKDFLYLEGMPEDRNNVPFYVRHGFSVMEDGAALQIVNKAFKD